MMFISYVRMLCLHTLYIGIDIGILVCVRIVEILILVFPQRNKSWYQRTLNYIADKLAVESEEKNISAAQTNMEKDHKIFPAFANKNRLLWTSKKTNRDFTNQKTKQNKKPNRINNKQYQNRIKKLLQFEIEEKKNLLWQMHSSCGFFYANFMYNFIQL